MVKTLLFFLLTLNILPVKAQSLVPFGDVRIGDAPIPLETENFVVILKGDDTQNLKVNLVTGSIQWIRDNSNLLIPRARLEVEVKASRTPPLFYYLSEVFSGPYNSTTDTYSVDLWVNLFNPGSIDVLIANKKIAQIFVEKKKAGPGQLIKDSQTKLIDYSCAPYHVTMEGLPAEYVSVGCRLEKIGSDFEKRPRLVITWTASNILLSDDKLPPYRVILTNEHPAHMLVKNNEGEISKVSFAAKLPKKLHRFKSALGLGPYILNSYADNKSMRDEWAPAFMIYAKYDLPNQSSLRLFNAVVKRESLFNNAGAYFAYELANLFDNRIHITPLLGAQLLSYDYGVDSPLQNQVIYPQGFEISWDHSFGLKNTHLTYGMFLSTDSNRDYKNIWLRFGKSWFGEVNYIEWQNGGQRVSTYGLSVGIPFFSAL